MAAAPAKMESRLRLYGLNEYFILRRSPISSGLPSAKPIRAPARFRDLEKVWVTRRFSCSGKRAAALSPPKST